MPRPAHTPATIRAASVSYIKLGGGLFRLRSASSTGGVMLRGLLAGLLAGVTVRSPPTLSASRRRLGFFAVSRRRKLRRFCMPTIAESTLTSARLKSPGRPHEIKARSAPWAAAGAAAAASLCCPSGEGSPLDLLYSRAQSVEPRGQP